MEHSYYGILNGKLKGENLGSFIVDETFKRIIERNAKDLEERQSELISKFKKSLKVFMDSFKNDVNKIDEKFHEIDKTFRKELSKIHDRFYEIEKSLTKLKYEKKKII